MAALPTVNHIEGRSSRDTCGHDPTHSPNYDVCRLDGPQQLGHIPLPSVQYQIRLRRRADKPFLAGLQVSDRHDVVPAPLQLIDCRVHILRVGVPGRVVPLGPLGHRPNNRRGLSWPQRRSELGQIEGPWANPRLPSHRIQNRANRQFAWPICNPNSPGPCGRAHPAGPRALSVLGLRP